MRILVKWLVPCLALAIGPWMAAVDAGAAPVSLEALLEPIRMEHRLPALAAVAVSGGETVGLGAVGFRRDGSPEQVTRLDKFHLGSCTKSMTATLAAMLVEEGQLSWDTTLAGAFPELAPAMQAEWRRVSLEQLLSQRGGAPHDLDADGLWERLWERAARPGREQRAYLTGELLTKQKPVAAPGTKYLYSNAGYALAGHLIETCLDQPWEEVLRARLFKPLGMASAGFGAPASPGQVDQPWGHIAAKDGKLQAIPPGRKADNPAAIGPGGTAHCSLADLAAYCNFHLGHTPDGPELLQPGTLQKLHTRAGTDGDYALGWAVTQRGWGGGEVLTHSGSNTMFYTVIWLAPLRDFGVAVCVNAGGDAAAKGADRAAGDIIRTLLARN